MATSCASTGHSMGQQSAPQKAIDCCKGSQARNKQPPTTWSDYE